jgi:RNA polymerase sigma-70 factor, ECF subfamily
MIFWFGINGDSKTSPQKVHSNRKNFMSLEGPITQLLERWRDGEKEALEELVPIVYQELRQMARWRVKRLPPGSAMQATALVHEVFLRLNEAEVDWRNRMHFFAIAARLMRQVAVEEARAQQSAKRGGGWRRLQLSEAGVVLPAGEKQVLAVNEALETLERLDARKARVVEMRFFGGMENAEIAEVLGVSVDTVKRDWKFAKLWLAKQFEVGGGE